MTIFYFELACMCVVYCVCVCVCVVCVCCVCVCVVVVAAVVVVASSREPIDDVMFRPLATHWSESFFPRPAGVSHSVASAATPCCRWRE